eukprot:COSAG03_NODE_15529_length_428_cov_0.920973_1_plen_109_part_01
MSSGPGILATCRAAETGPNITRGEHQCVHLCPAHMDPRSWLLTVSEPRTQGRAPTADPCGIAGGYSQARGGGGQTPVGAKQGDRGSDLSPHTGLRTVWNASTPHEVGWM